MADCKHSLRLIAICCFRPTPFCKIRKNVGIPWLVSDGSHAWVSGPRSEFLAESLIKSEHNETEPITAMAVRPPSVANLRYTLGPGGAHRRLRGGPSARSRRRQAGRTSGIHSGVPITDVSGYSPLVAVPQPNNGFYYDLDGGLPLPRAEPAAFDSFDILEGLPGGGPGKRRLNRPTAWIITPLRLTRLTAEGTHRSSIAS